MIETNREPSKNSNIIDDLDPHVMNDIITDFNKIASKIMNGSIIDNVNQVLEERFNLFEATLDISREYTLKVLDSHYHSIGNNDLVINSNEELKPKKKKKKIKKHQEEDKEIKKFAFVDESKASVKVHEKIEVEKLFEEKHDIETENIPGPIEETNVFKRLDNEYKVLEEAVKEIEGKMNLIAVLSENISKKSLQELFTFDNNNRVVFYKLKTDEKHRTPLVVNWTEPRFKEITKQEDTITFNSNKCGVWNSLDIEVTNSTKSLGIEFEYNNESANEENLTCIGFVNEFYDFQNSCICKNAHSTISLNSKGQLLYNYNVVNLPNYAYGKTNISIISIGIIPKDKKVMFSVNNSKQVGPFSLSIGNKYKIVVCGCGTVEKTSFVLKNSQYLN